jgi:serine/threonine-protein kinase
LVPSFVEQAVAKAPSIEDRLLGQIVAGKYHLVEVRASGAFGTVFKAHQFFCNHFVRTVAVKVSHQTGLTEDKAGYVFSDALILAQLLAGGSPHGKQHLVPIYDMGLLPDYDDRGFLVMEYVDGFPLLAHIQAAGRIGVVAGLRYIKEICRGLAVIHAQGAVHRDLKPDNVLLDRAGVVRLVDFGLASFTDPRLGFAPGAMGTFTYMAPETLQGRSTPTADVYGVGLIMYELFTGGGPHLTAPWPDAKEDNKQEHQRIKNALVFSPPSTFQNEIRNEHRWLDALIQRCLELDPQRRFADAGQLLAAIELGAAGGNLPDVGMPVSAEQPARAYFPDSTGPVDQDRDPPDAGGTGKPPVDKAALDDLFREVRKLLASRAYEKVIDRLDIHRPAEWQVIDLRAARTLRALGQAYLGRGDFSAARDCLEQLRAGQREQIVLARQEHAAALSDLVKCYRGLGFSELAEACQEEARSLLQ